MATGAEHYRRAEELVSDIEDSDGTVDFGDGGEAYVAAAQVHATLALAAATASPLVHQMCGDSDRTTDWGNAIGWNTVPTRIDVLENLLAWARARVRGGADDAILSTYSRGRQDERNSWVAEIRRVAYQLGGDVVPEPSASNVAEAPVNCRAKLVTGMTCALADGHDGFHSHRRCPHDWSATRCRLGEGHPGEHDWGQLPDRTWPGTTTSLVLEPTLLQDSIIQLRVTDSGDGMSAELSAAEAREVAAELLARADFLDPSGGTGG
jgi:hypothetical protein